MKHILWCLLLSGCIYTGPHAMKVEPVAPLVDRMENEEMICYVVGSVERDKTLCRWKMATVVADPVYIHPRPEFRRKILHEE
ncbi:MAG: hypothetical protein ACYTEU_06175 [Planctomycetota bacterium]|jgi:hypothetical protein